MDLMLLNLHLLGLLDEERHDMGCLVEYVSKVSAYTGVPIHPSYPLAGRDAFRTATGVHAAAVIKAHDKGDLEVADRVYSSVPARVYGRRQEIEVGHYSGRSNVVYWLKERGLEPEPALVDRIFAAAKAADHTLTEDELKAIVGEHSGVMKVTGAVDASQRAPISSDEVVMDEPTTSAELELGLLVTDREVIDALAAIEDPERRTEFALTALRLGVLALNQAHNQIDAASVRQEGERMVDEMSRVVREHTGSMVHEVTTAFREYFDPRDGKFSQRIERLTAGEGELAGVLRAHVAGSDSELAKTLAQHVGTQSPLFRRLDPEHADSLTHNIETILDDALASQRRSVLAQFTLDDEESALSRLVKHITDANGQLKREFTEDFTKVVAQFTLDDDDSALSRLVRQVEKTRDNLVQQFSLDDQASALSRLKREMMASIDTLTAQQRRFQQEVLESLASIATRKEMESKSTTHGLLFERRLERVLEDEAGRAGDVLHSVGSRPGQVRHSKKGDFVIELGPESTAPGAKIVIEAKDARNWDDGRARVELELARKNRGADVGIFVYSSNVAATMVPFRRVGHDLMVVWDPEDARSDVYPRAAISVARALLFRQRNPMPEADVDFTGLNRAILEVEQQARKLDNVTRASETIQKSAERILDEVRKMKDALQRQTTKLHRHADMVHRALGREAAVESPSPNDLE